PRTNALPNVAGEADGRAGPLCSAWTSSYSRADGPEHGRARSLPLGVRRPLIWPAILPVAVNVLVSIKLPSHTREREEESNRFSTRDSRPHAPVSGSARIERSGGRIRQGPTSLGLGHEASDPAAPSESSS